MANEVAVQGRGAAMVAFRQEFDLREQMVKSFLPAHVTFDKFKATVMAALQMKPDLLDCTKQSLVKAAIEAAELGLSLNPALGEGDILKVWNKKLGKSEAQFRPRYGGLMKLARQSGDVRMIEARIVREGDAFDYEYGLEPRLSHRPSASTGKVTHAYCVWVLATGEKNFEVMDREQIDAIMRRSSSKTKEGQIVGPWVSDYDEMARKTVVRRASKYMPRSAEAFNKAVAMDNLRESGHDVELQDGEVVDITDDGDEGAVEEAVRETVVREKQGQQMAALEQKVTTPVPTAAAPAPAQAAAPERRQAAPRRAAAAPDPLGRVAIPTLKDKTGEYPDYQGWANLCVAAIQKLPPAQYAAWAQANMEVIEDVDFQAPGDAARVREACGLPEAE